MVSVVIDETRVMCRPEFSTSAGDTVVATGGLRTAMDVAYRRASRREIRQVVTQYLLRPDWHVWLVQDVR